VARERVDGLVVVVVGVEREVRELFHDQVVSLRPGRR
jgi:hypothetical protein